MHAMNTRGSREVSGAKMDNCPTCGALLSAALVAAIRNPSSDEACPKAPAPKPRESVTAPRQITRADVDTIGRLAVLMMIGRRAS